ncbi:MAG: hypothetical protein QM778_28495 [Myxococcales bacterium]
MSRCLWLLLPFAASGCDPAKDDKPFQFLPPGDDAGPGSVRAPIFSNEMPALTPYPILPLRGTVPANELGNQYAQYVFIEGLGDPRVAYAIGGNFCLEVPLKPGQYHVSARAQDRFGQTSEITRFSVAYDPSAPRVPNLRNCEGQDDLWGCDPKREDCSNGKDDDCDGLVDGNDPSCGRPCGYDALEPVEGDVTEVESGYYDNLKLCSELDSYAFSVRFDQGATFVAQAFTPERSLRATLRGEDGRALWQNPADGSDVLLHFLPSDVLGLEQALGKETHRFTMELTEAGDGETSYAFALVVSEAGDNPLRDAGVGDFIPRDGGADSGAGGSADSGAHSDAGVDAAVK